MRSVSTLLLAAALGAAAPAFAQGVDTGMEVQVNPAAAAGGSRVLLYPGGEYTRSVPQLLYPGQPSGPIRLHMPSKRHHMVAASVAPGGEAVAPRPKPAPKPKKVAKAETPLPAPQAQATPPASDSNPYFGAPNMANIFGGTPASPSKPVAKPAPKQQLASAAPPAKSSEAGLTKRSVILFAKDAGDPAEGALKSIGFLATDLNAAMTSASARVELQAYGGAHGDKGSDARRLSLKRALSIRQILIDDGLSPDRIDVRAMGGSDDTGPADRVDVFVKA